MSDPRANFEMRLKTIGRKHNAMSRSGCVAQMRGDGLMVAKPKRFRGRVNLPLRGMVLFTLGFFAFKGFMLTSIGEVGYTQRVQALAEGTAIEQVGAKVMQIDPVSMVFAEAIGKMARRI